MPLRPAGTHAYVISPAGARKLLAGCPRANYHVDVAAWGLRALQLFCVNPLLAKQTHADTTIGGNQDFAWISSRTGPLVFDRYTGADLAWAYNTPLLRLGGDSWFVLLSTGRIFSVYLLGLLASFLTRANTTFGFSLSDDPACSDHYAVMQDTTYAILSFRVAVGNRCGGPLNIR